VSTTTTTATVGEAIEELRQTFGEAVVTSEDDPVPLGPAYAQETSWIAFQITFPYPEADVYPLFVRPDLHRKDGGSHGEGFQAVTWGPHNRPGTQLSRRSNRLNPAIDTAATKVLKVLKWLSEQ
jgi:hypothetical protein